MKITIKKSPTADTRTCDWTNVSQDQLYYSSIQHISDVQLAMQRFILLMNEAAVNHDHTKIGELEQFYADFKTGFKQQSWYDMHKATERHHINHPDGCRDDVNLIDVLEHIADCVMAGKARAGSVTKLELPNEVLQKAFENTWKLLDSIVDVE